MLGQLHRLGFATASAAEAATGRGLSAAAQRGVFSTGGSRQGNGQLKPQRSNILAATITENRSHSVDSKLFDAPGELQVYQAFPEANGSLPAALYRLLDPAIPVDFPAASAVNLGPSDNRELDKLVAALGRNKATWRRAILLHEWLLQIGHKSDDRLLTTLIRVCAQHGQVATAIQLYDWMRTPVAEGGAGLKCTVYTYTAAMRAALAGNLTDKALKVWEDAERHNSNDIDCRLCTTLIEVYARRGDTDAAIATYRRMKQAPPESKLAPTVHAYTAVMRAAAEGGQWEAALGIWDDMEAAGCKPTGHAYAAAISACAAGGLWQRAVALFDSMLAWGIKPDVVSCTALVTALGADGQWERAEKVVEWMLRNDIRPNVRTYTALVSALANAKQWERAVSVLKQMKGHVLGSAVEPNAYTYSALLKAMGDHGKWALAEAVFADLEEEALAYVRREASSHNAASASSSMVVNGVGGSVASVSTSSALHSSNTSNGGGQMSPRSNAAGKVAAFPGMRHALAVPAYSATTTPAVDDPILEEVSVEEQAAAANVVAATMATVLDSGDLSKSLAELKLAEPGVDSGDVSPSSMQEVSSPAAVLSLHNTKDRFGGGAGSRRRSFSEKNPLPSSSSSSSGLSTVSEGGATPTAAVGPTFSYFSSSSPTATTKPTTAAVKDAAAGAWTAGNAALNGLSFTINTPSLNNNHINNTAPSSPRAVAPIRPKGPLNEVVCGALMLAYERAGKWQEAVNVLERARTLGIPPNTVMYNTAISALGKAGQLETARALFSQIPRPDAVSYETMIAAHGMAGEASRAEALLQELASTGHVPQDYAYCGLIAAYSSKGDLKSALKVKDRMKQAGVQPTVHVYNALIAACDRGQQYDKAIALSREMKEIGVGQNSVTQQLLQGVCREGVKVVENQQAAIAALTAAVAAAGSVMIRAGIF